MKVVLFCGGLGLRLREYSRTLPKPMVPIGDTPVLLHVMKYYAAYGHTDFILCLGYMGSVIKAYFDERGAAYRDPAPRQLENGALADEAAWRGWTVTFVQTGEAANIGDRLRAVRPLLVNEDLFLANYSDDLTDAPLDELITDFRSRSGVVAGFLAVRPNLSFHVVLSEPEGVVTGVVGIRETPIRVNGGYFILRPEIFDVMRPGEELVEEPFRRLVERRALWAYEHSGFWGPLDTLKDHHALEEWSASGNAPWMRWQHPDAPQTTATPSSSVVRTIEP